MRIKSFPSNEGAESKGGDEAQNIKSKARVSAGSRVNFMFLNEEE